jgi:hypothetical protein
MTASGGFRSNPLADVGLSPIAAVSELASEVTVDASAEVVLCLPEVMLGSLPVLVRG